MAKIKVPARRLSSKDPSLRDGSWWRLGGEEQRGQALWETVQILNKEHAPRHMDDACYVGLYRNQPPYWTGARRDPMLSTTVVTPTGSRVPLNLVKSVIDTAAAMLSKNTAELRAFTSGGSWRDQRKAKWITKFNAGAFYLNGYHRHQQRAFRDGCLSKARGAVRFWGDETSGMVRCARVHPRTLLWNDLEGDNPLNLYQWFPFPRQTLLQQFPKKRAIIEDCSPSVNPVNPAYRRQSAIFQHADLIDVAIGWHNGVRGEEDSGRELVRVEKGSLKDDPYPHEMPPIATFSWDDEDEGWGGIPLADTLAGFQSEISTMTRINRKALMRAAASAGVWVEETGEPDGGDDNTGEVWARHRYRGQPPVFMAPVGLGRDFFETLVWLYDKGFAEAGFSQLQAQGTKPEGLDAAVALREYNDITATRQVPKGQRYERQTEDAGKIQMMIARDLYSKGVKVRARAPGTKFLEEIDFADIADMEEDAYVLRCSATSSLPTHFVGKVQMVSELIRSGVLPEDQVKDGLGLRLLQMPDLEKETDISTAARELTEMQCDEALYEGRFIPPSPYQSPDLLLERAQNSHLFAQTLKGVPRRNMQLLERLMSEADAIRKRAQPQVGMAPGGPAAQAINPGAPPQLGAPAGAVNTQVIEQAAVPLQQPAPLPSPAVPSAVPA